MHKNSYHCHQENPIYEVSDPMGKLKLQIEKKMFENGVYQLSRSGHIHRNLTMQLVSIPVVLPPFSMLGAIVVIEGIGSCWRPSYII
jgi:hypothetical protein